MNQEKTYCVYKHTNKSNGKVYIGITCRKPEVRWNNGKGYENNEYFYRAIQKYGWEDGFIHEIIADGLTKKDACKIEIELIATYDSTNYDKGYNCSAGGECGNAGCLRSREWVDKMRNSLIKPVVCVETGVTYKSLTEAVQKTGINGGGISGCCHNHKRTAGGYHWCFLKDYEGKRSYFKELNEVGSLKSKKQAGQHRIKSLNNKRSMGKRNTTK